MSEEAEVEQFIARAEAKIGRLASTALRGAERFLDPDHWRRWCDTTAELHVEFYGQMERSLTFLVAHPSSEPPALLQFLLTADLEASFPPLDVRSARYGELTSAIKYLVAKALTRRLTQRSVTPDHLSAAEAAFAALWALPGADEMSTLERWQAYDALLHLAAGDHGWVIRTYEQRHRFDLARHEGSHRTLIKECYMLSRVATGDADEDLRFGAAAYAALLRFNYYLWLVNEDPSAEIELVPLALLCHLQHDLLEAGEPYDFFASMAPRKVLEEMRALKAR